MADYEDLPEGLYEQLITSRLKQRLARFDPTSAVVRTHPIDPAEAHALFARHIESIVARTLRELPEKDRREHQTDLANALIQLLQDDEERIVTPPEELRSIQKLTGDLGHDRNTLVAPLVPLSAADLLVNAHGEPALAYALVHEIPSSDEIDLLCAFVRWHGVRVLADQLTAHCRAGRPLRVITTVYTGSTERKALDWLVSIGAKVKVSYDIQSTSRLLK